MGGNGVQWIYNLGSRASVSSSGHIQKSLGEAQFYGHGSGKRIVECHSCKNHIITREKARPIPLHELLAFLPIFCWPRMRASEDPLHELSARRYWDLREQSRAARVNITAQSRLVKDELDSYRKICAKGVMKYLFDQADNMAVEAQMLTEANEARDR